MKRAFVLLLAIMVISLLFAGCAKPATTTTPTTPTTPTTQEPIVLKFAAGVALASMEYTHIDNFMKAVEERSDGRLRIDYFPSPTLCAIDQILESIMSGVAEMGQVSATYEQAMLPYDYAWSLPQLWDGPEGGFEVFEEMYDEFFKPRYDELGLHYLGYNIHVGAVLYTIDKPVYTREDLKGMTIRSYSEALTKIWTACDAIPMQGSANEQYELLQKKLLQASPNIPHNIPAFSLEELGDPGYVIDMGGLPATCNLYCINQEKYDSLSGDLQQILDEAGREFLSLEGNTDLVNAAEEAMTYLKDYGCEIIIWSDAEKASFREEVMLPIWDDLATDLDGAGLPGTEFVARIRELTSK